MRVRARRDVHQLSDGMLHRRSFSSVLLVPPIEERDRTQNICSRPDYNIVGPMQDRSATRGTPSPERLTNGKRDPGNAQPVCQRAPKGLDVSLAKRLVGTGR